MRSMRATAPATSRLKSTSSGTGTGAVSRSMMKRDTSIPTASARSLSACQSLSVAITARCRLRPCAASFMPSASSGITAPPAPCVSPVLL